MKFCSTFFKDNPRRTLFLALVAVAAVAGSIHSAYKVGSLLAARQNKPVFFYGDLFEPIREILQTERYVGYYTDKDLKIPSNSAQMGQAQFILAPVLIDRSLNHRFILFDCQDERECWRKLHEIRAKAVKRSPTGVILAIRP